MILLHACGHLHETVTSNGLVLNTLIYYALNPKLQSLDLPFACGHSQDIESPRPNAKGVRGHPLLQIAPLQYVFCNSFDFDRRQENFTIVAPLRCYRWISTLPEKMSAYRPVHWSPLMDFSFRHFISTLPTLLSKKLVNNTKL